jgi:hypothetical protein
MQSIKKQATWRLTDLPHGRQAITSKWLCKTKLHADSTPASYKAKLVVQDFRQRPGVDFDATFALVAKYNSLRILVALATHQSWPICHLDVKTAFLNSKFHHIIYIKQPQVYIVRGQEHKVCVLDGALYGLRQSAREWYLTVDKTIRSLGLSRSSAESNLYYFQDQGRIAVLLLYVDDMYFTGNHLEKIDWLH